MPVVVDTAHFLLERDPALRRVLLRRTDSKFPLQDIDAVFAPVEAAVVDVAGDWDVLVDLRRAPARVEAGFEAAMSAHMEPLLARFRRRALLVRSAVGVLQVSRVSGHMSAQDKDTAVFRDDEAAAVAFLAG